MIVRYFLGMALLFLLLSQQVIVAQQWYEPSLKTNNMKADTCCDSETLLKLLIYYQRLAESEPHLWVTYYYQSYINFKLSNLLDANEQKIQYLQKAFNLALFSQNRFRSNIEVNALFGAVSASCMRWGAFENTAQKRASIEQVIDTLSCNPRMYIAKTILLLCDTVQNKNILVAIKPKLAGLYQDSSFFYSTSPYSPAWGRLEIEQLLNDF